MKKTTFATVACAFLLCIFSVSFAQFSGPSVSGRERTVEQIASARIGSYIVLTGNIISHQRGDYYTFRDKTGTIRVEIENNVWQNRNITPETNVRLLGEVDRGASGRYIWVKSLDVVK